MGGFISGVIGFFSAIITSIVNIVKALFTLNFMALLFEPLRPICYLLGIVDRDITNGSASLVKVFHKSEFPDTRVRLISEKARNGSDLPDMYWGYSYTGQNQYDKYFYYAQSNFMDHLPEGHIGSSGIDAKIVVNALKDDLHLNNVYIDSIDYGIPSNYVWAQWYLQEHNGYKLASNTVIINDIVYEVVNAIYDMDRNKIVAYLTAVSSIRVVVVDRTIVTIEPLDNVNDKKTTVVKRETTKYTDGYEIISFTSSTVSTAVVNVPKDSEENSETVATVSETEEHPSNPNITLDINPPQHVNFYQVIYAKVGTSDGNKLWLCSITDPRYNLSNPDKRIEQAIDLFPIVALRNSKVDVRDAENNNNCTASFRRPGRYAQSKEMLQQIGIPIDKLIDEYRKNDSINDVYDVFFVVGISPKQTMDDYDEDPQGNDFSRQCVGRLLYETVDYIYRCLPCVQTGQTYYVTFSEDPFRGGVYWGGVPPTRRQGKVCDLYDVVMDMGTVKLSKVKVKKIDRLVRTENYYSDSDYYYSSYNQRKRYIYHYSQYDVQVEGRVTGKAISDALDGVDSSGGGEISLLEELASLPVYRVDPVSTYSYYDSENSGPSYSSINLDVNDNSTELSRVYLSDTVTIDSLTLDYQIAMSEYRRIVLRDMHSLAFTDEVDQGLVSVSKVSESGFFMPLAVKSLEQLNLYDKNKLVSEAFYMMFFAKRTQHLEFYQTPEFATFIKIIGICIIIIVQIFTWWTGPTTSLTLTAVLMAVLKMIVIAVALTLAIHLIQTFVKDPMLKMALTAAAMVAAMYAGGGFDNFDFSSILQLVEIPCKIAEMYVGDEMKALQQDYNEFQSGAERSMQEMKEQKAALDTGMEVEDIVQLQSATRMAGLSNISVDSWFFLAKNIAPVDYVYDQYSQLYDFDSKFDLAF